MGYLKQIDVENFKSWRGKETLGPFKRFNCIIGTNGSGKSNIMDALAFVVGERVGALRVGRLRDLIHGAHTGRPVASSAAVSMTYCCGERGEQETVFSRRISGNSSEYSVNGVSVSLAKYKKDLENIGILTKARNCLVFQGAAESIAMETAKERTKLFERISQSDEFAAEYERQREALHKAKDDTQFHYYRKKTATAERKQVSREKQEAQKYQALVDSLAEKRLQLLLFRMFRNQQDISALASRLEERAGEVAEQRSGLAEGEAAARALKKEHGRLTREQLGLGKEIRAEEQKLAQAQSKYIKTKVNTSHCVKKAEEARAALRKVHRLRAKREAEVADIRREMAELEAAWRSYERGMQEDGASGGLDIQLREEQLEQYKELKERARQQAALLCQRADRLQLEVTGDRDKIALDHSKTKRVEAGVKNQGGWLEDLTHRAEKLTDYISGCRASLEKYGQQERSLSEALDHSRQRSQEVEQELGQVLEELGDARLDHQESQREQQRKEILQNMRRMYPNDVYGRLVDLCSPIHRKYQLAVTKVFGRYLNAVVVSTEKVACSGIQYLRQERAEAETFLPINYLIVSPLNERLRELRGAKMVVDVVQCNSEAVPALKKVLQFVCGNAVVCESIQDAQRLAFSGPQRLKTVALDGTLFTTSGVISGGSSYLRTKARCWEDQDLRKLKERKDQLTAELRGLLKTRAKESELKGVQVQAQGVQTRLKYSEKDLETLVSKDIPNCQAEISYLESELLNLEADVQMQQKSVEVKEVEMKNVRARMDQMEDLVFADFCAQIGVNNIRQYEQEHLKNQSELDRKRLEFDGQRGRLAAQLEYEVEQGEQQQRKLRQLEETIAKEDVTIAQQTEEERELLGVVEEGQNHILDLNDLLQAKTLQIREAKARLDQETKSLQEANRELAGQQRALVTLEMSLEQLRLAKHNLLWDCKVQGLDLCLVSGDPLQEFSESESAVVTADIYEREAQLVIDYSRLGAELKRVMTERDAQAELERLGEEVSSVEYVLRTTSAPNLKALEQMRGEEERYHQVVRAFTSSSSATRSCSQQFERIKALRCRRFNQGFEHVATAIDHIYKRLCRNTSAQAILSAENIEEPYLGGINYNCVAPGKRFMSMDNLSGGEKAIAALALLFAIHSFRPAPFFILDEVDAALDNTNIGKVTSFIREESKERMQFIIISLKKEFYSRADALLGVYPQFNGCMASGRLLLDLQPYAMHQEDPDE